MIEARAPGKVVLWGEYAVLGGAPAMVMAVDRLASCRLGGGGDRWQFSALGFRAPPAQVSRQTLLGAEPPGPDAVWRTAWQVLRHLNPERLPATGQARLDTRSFHQHGEKLGLGSSAAVCVAAYGAFCRLLDQHPSFDAALEIHRALQGGRGSGIDVAAAWHGGTMRFETAVGPGASALAVPAALAPEIHVGFVWAGRPARTADHLARFAGWREGGCTGPLEDLGTASRRLFDTTDPLGDLADYVASLHALDRAAGLGIYSDAHHRLEHLANDAGVVYKPCGAGGGDIGAAFATDAQAIRRFTRLATAAGFLHVPLETTPHGLEITG